MSKSMVRRLEAQLADEPKEKLIAIIAELTQERDRLVERQSSEGRHALRVTIAQLEAKLSTASERFEALRAERNDLFSRLDSLEQERDKLIRAVGEHVTVRSELRSDLAAAESRLDSALRALEVVMDFAQEVDLAAAAAQYPEIRESLEAAKALPVERHALK